MNNLTNKNNQNIPQYTRIVHSMTIHAGCHLWPPGMVKFPFITLQSWPPYGIINGSIYQQKGLLFLESVNDK